MNNNQLDFIAQYLRHRDACTAYCLAYKPTDCSDYEKIMAAAGKLMDDPEVGGLIDAVLRSVRHDAEQQIRAEQRTELLTVQRKRELLAKIATGEMYIAQNYKGKDCSQCTQMVTPTINQMLKAIDIDNRMAGHYADTRHKSEPVHPTDVDDTENTQQSTTLVAPGIYPDLFGREDKRVAHEGQQNTTIQEEAPLPTKVVTLERASQHEPTGQADLQKTGNHNNLQQKTTKKHAPWKRVG